MSELSKKTDSHRWITALVVVAVGIWILLALAAGLFALYAWPSVAQELFLSQAAKRQEPLAAAVAPKATVAVVPFVNESPEVDYEWLGYGFAYGTVSRLANFEELVIARPEEIREELANEQSELTLGDITSLAAAQEAGEAVYADYVLMGNCAKSGDEIRVTAQIVEVATGNIHSERAGVREYANIFDFQAELVRWVADTLDVTTDSARLERIEYKPTQSIPAYECFGQGVMHYYRGEYEEAAAACQKAVDIDSDLADAYVVLARALGCQEEYGEAIAQLKKAEKLDAERPYLHYYLGIAYEGNEDYDEAVDQLRQAVQCYPSDPHVRRWLGNAYHESYQYPRAIAEYKEALVLRPNWALVHCDLGWSYHVSGRTNRAIEECKKAIQLCRAGNDLLRGSAHHVLGRAYGDRGELEKGLYHLKQAATLAPNKGNIQYNLARTYKMLEHWDEAIACYEKGVIIFREKQDLIGEADCHYGISRVYQKKREHQLALKHCKKRLDLVLAAIEKHETRKQEALRSGDQQTAANEAAKVEELRYGELASAYNRYGAVHTRLGKPEVAIEYVNKALELNPDYYWAHWNLAFAYDNMGEKDKAIYHYQKRLDEAPSWEEDDEHAQHARKRLEELRGELEELSE